MMTVHIMIWMSRIRTLTVGCGYNDLRLASWFFLKIVLIIYHLCSLLDGSPSLSLIVQRHRTLVWSFRPSQYLLIVSCRFSYSSLFRIFFSNGQLVLQYQLTLLVVLFVCVIYKVILFLYTTIYYMLK